MDYGLVRSVPPCVLHRCGVYIRLLVTGLSTTFIQIDGNRSHTFLFLYEPRRIEIEVAKNKFKIMYHGFRIPTVYAVKSKKEHEDFVYLTLQKIKNKKDEFVVRIRKDAKPSKVKHLIEEFNHSNVYYVYLFEIVDDNLVVIDKITLSALNEENQIAWMEEAEIPEYLQHLYNYEAYECDCLCK